MIKPKCLKKGDKIGLVAPCSHVKDERIPLCIKFFEDLGLEVKVGESVYDSHGYLSGSDSIRARDINNMFSDTSIKGIFAIRGGYGGARLLDKLDYKSIKKNPKIFAGYSDVTCIHSVLNQKCNLITYHTPMVGTELYKEVDEFTKQSFIDLIFSDKKENEICNPKANKMSALNKGNAKGRLCGGNLSVLVASLGTKYEINTKRKILFLEDVGEPLYKIDRMLLQLKQSNKIKDANGIIFGTFHNCKCEDTKKSLTLMQILEELIIPENKPTLFNCMCGHSLPCMSLPLGDKLFIDCDTEKIIDLGN